MVPSFLRPVFFAFVFCLSGASLSAQIRLAEIAPTNTGQITDEDGDHPDWIELINAGASAASLDGLSLSDAGRTGQWPLPAATLAPGERLLVFASGKNRGSVAPNTVNHWETAVYEGDTWHYSSTQPPADWAAKGFDDSGWGTAPGGFGYGDGDDTTELPAGTLSFFLRRSFTASDTAQLVQALLHLDYDDGFAAYLNGTEIARSANLPPGSAWDALTSIDHEALMYNGGLPEAFLIEKNALTALLQPGENVLAIEIHNIEAGSSDLSARAWLSFGIGSAATFFSPTPTWFNAGNPGGSANLHTNFKIAFREKIDLFDAGGSILDSLTVSTLEPGHSQMRLNDTGPWCISDNPSPGLPNGAACLSGYAQAPQFTLAAGFYTGDHTVGLVPGGPGIVRYTTDGSWPDQNAPVFSQNLDLSATTLLRARRFETGKLPSRTTTASYFLNEPVTVSVVSIALDPGDFPAVYDNYSDKGRVNVEFFDQNRQRQFATEACGYVVGNWSVAFPQKSLQFDIDEEWGSLGEIAYPLFAPDKPIERFHSFRIRNEDDDAWGARMRDRIVNDLARPTHSGQAAFRNVVAFINGEYWGLYSARERLDNYFVRDNYGADPDSVNMIKTHWGLGNYIAEYGTTDDFFELSDFITGHDMSLPGNFQAVGERLDLDNFTDYFATEIFVASTDWLQDYFNNIRLFRTPDLRWNFLLWDVSYSSGGASGCAACDVLGSTINNPFGSRYGAMFDSLLNNPEYKRFFINRFADLLNTSFQPGVVHALIDKNAAEMAPEIDRHNGRWATGDLAAWSWQVQTLKDFYSQRPAFQRQHLRDHFDLPDEVSLTLEVYPPGAGHIKISTIIPEDLPWTGTYFHGNPVTLTAIPAPGYTFSNWSASSFITDPAGKSFTADVSVDTVFRANFIGTAAPMTLAVGEINYHSDPTRDAGDWLELLNFGAAPLDLSDCSIGDSEWYHRFVLPTGTVLPPDGRLVLFENKGLITAEHPGLDPKLGPLGFSLSDKGDSLHLHDAFGHPIEAFAFSDKKPWPRTPDGYGRTLERAAPDNDPGQPDSWFDGCVGGSPAQAYTPCEENPLVSEINYKSSPDFDAGDWFELFNRSAQDFDLSGWRARDDDDQHEFVIPAGTVLPPGGYRVFFQDEAKFIDHFPAVSNISGPLGFGLSGNGDLIRLFDPSGRLQFSLHFDDAAPWPAGADGEGFTLENAGYDANPNAGTNWFSGCYGGSPGTAFDPDCGTSATGDGHLSLPTVLVFPQPAKDYLAVRLPDPSLSFDIRLFDACGVLLLEKTRLCGDARIDLSGIPAGMYLLKVKTGAFSISKFVALIR